MGFFAVCDYCFEHKPLGEIDDATLKLHYERLSRGHDEDINGMIEETHKEYERTIARQHDSTKSCNHNLNTPQDSPYRSTSNPVFYTDIT